MKKTIFLIMLILFICSCSSMRDAEYKRMQCTMIEQQREIHQLKKELGIYKKFSLGKQITARDLDRILQKLLKKDQD